MSSYQVIARKYRPQRFADVVGQEHVTQTLSNAIAQNRIAHAYLFCGPRGTGKTTIARIFAKCLNCTGGPMVDFDESDSRCSEITEGRALDVLEIDGASNNGVEQVRELRDTIRFAPASSRYKIYIIDEVHMLSTAAFNALLKTLEEPPAHAKFLFATTDPEKVLPTILSRCQRFDLRRIPVALIVQHLAQISVQEKVQISDAALHAVARGADGGMRDAESALDQLISFCGHKIEEEDVLSMFGLTSSAQVLGIAMAILGGNAEVVLRELSVLTRHGKDLTRLLGDVIGHFRNLLVYQVSGGDLSLLEVSEGEAASLKENAPIARADALTRILEVLTESEGRMREAASKKIYLEVAFFKALQARNAMGLDAVLQQLKQLRSGAAPTVASPAAAASRGTASAPISKPAVVPAPAPVVVRSSVPAAASAVTANPSSPAMAPEAGLEPAKTLPLAAAGSMEALWPQLLEAVGRVSQFTRSYLVEAFPVSMTGNLLTIGFDPEFASHIDLVNNTRNVEILQTKLKELGHPNFYVKFIQAEAPAERPRVDIAAASAPEPVPIPVAPPVPKAAVASSAKKSSLPAPSPAAAAPAAPVKLDPSDFKNDPLIQKALEVFRGRIVEVKA